MALSEDGEFAGDAFVLRHERRRAPNFTHVVARVCNLEKPHAGAGAPPFVGGEAYVFQRDGAAHYAVL